MVTDWMMRETSHFRSVPRPFRLFRRPFLFVRRPFPLLDFGLYYSFSTLTYSDHPRNRLKRI
jgi:hypothetical protein